MKDDTTRGSASTQRGYGGRDATTSAGLAELTRPTPAAGQPQPRVGLQVTVIFLLGGPRPPLSSPELSSGFRDGVFPEIHPRGYLSPWLTCGSRSLPGKGGQSRSCKARACPWKDLLGTTDTHLLTGPEGTCSCRAAQTDPRGLSKVPQWCTHGGFPPGTKPGLRLRPG